MLRKLCELRSFAPLWGVGTGHGSWARTRGSLITNLDHIKRLERFFSYQPICLPCLLNPCLLGNAVEIASLHSHPTLPPCCPRSQSSSPQQHLDAGQLVSQLALAYTVLLYCGRITWMNALLRVYHPYSARDFWSLASPPARRLATTLLIHLLEDTAPGQPGAAGPAATAAAAAAGGLTGGGAAAGGPAGRVGAGAAAGPLSPVLSTLSGEVRQG